MIASTTPGTHNPRLSAQTVTNRLREIGERPRYTMYVLDAAFLFWPSICVGFKVKNQKVVMLHTKLRGKKYRLTKKQTL